MYVIFKELTLSRLLIKSCRVALMFQWSDMKYLTNKDIEYQYSPTQAQKTQYIECPICHARMYRVASGYTSRYLEDLLDMWQEHEITLKELKEQFKEV